MKKIIKENWRFLLLVLLGGLIGGYCIGIYSYDTLSADVLNELNKQNITKEIVGLSTMIQYGILFGVLLAIFGIIISKEVNLWQNFKYNKKALVLTIIITIIAALILFPGDKLIFGEMNTWVKEQYTISPTIYKILGGLLVGGIIEEVMMSTKDNYEEKEMDYKVGDFVYHENFGAGTVLEIIPNLKDASKTLLKIAFKYPYGVKTLIYNHKNLRKV